MLRNLYIQIKVLNPAVFLTIWGLTQFKKKNFGGHTSILGLLIPLFWTSGDVSSGFYSQSGQSYLHLAEAHVIHVYTFPEIHLWLDTFADVYGQHSSQSLRHLHVSTEVGCPTQTGDLLHRSYVGNIPSYLYVQCRQTDQPDSWCHSLMFFKFCFRKETVSTWEYCRR